MRIRKIQLQNFRSHVDTTLELDRLTVVRGTNAAGKSSIEQAIEITLAGHAEGTTADGKGSVNFIRAGAAKAFVTMALQQTADNPDERILKCALNGTARTVVVTKPGDPAYNGGEEWKEWLTMNRSTLSCLVNNRYFVDLSEDEQKNVLASIILPKQHEWPEWVRQACFDLELGINWAKTPFEIIDQGYDAAFKARTNVNRDVKNFRIPEGNTEGHEQYEEFATKLKARREELDAAKAKKSKLEEDFRLKEGIRVAATQRLEESQARLSREEQSIAGIEERMVSTSKLKDLEKTAKNAKRAGDLDKELISLDAQIAEKKKQRQALDKLSTEPKCPTCDSSITEDLIVAIASPIITALNELGENRQTIIDARKALGNPEEAAKQIADHKQAEDDMKRAKERIRDEQAIVKDAQEKLDELGSLKAPDTAAVEQEIADLISKVRRGEEATEQASKAADLHRRKATAEEEKKKLIESQAKLNKLVEYFGSEGVKAELLAASIGAFTDSMNAVLEQWGYSCQMSIEPYVFAIVFRDSDNLPHPIPLKFLSKSQRYRFAAAFQVALAVISGFKFVIVDDADIYDQKGRNGLFEALRCGQLDQAIVLSTDERLNVPDIPNTVFYRMDDVAAAGMIPTTQVRKLLPAQTQAA